MAETSVKTIEFTTKLLRDGVTFGVRYVCDCGCRPQVRLTRDAPAAHEHCCCGIAHAAGPDARGHLTTYLAERKAAGEDADRVYFIAESRVSDPWGGSVPVAYAVPMTADPAI
ncbi:MAG TPA: hypothetical protein VKT80_08880 [Chloroflexota bacterium]|nr:hypothetical protein [Chloroflexota bacterium]